jgi:acyl transferase domain-containing protein
MAVAGRTASELIDGLDRTLEDGAQSAPRASAAYDAPVFVFTGQGPQWWGMGRELYEREPIFRTMMERCDAAVRRHAPFSLLEELRKDEASSGVQETHVAQPVIFALQVSLSALLESWGVKPRAVVGHSVGEIAAAYVAGALSLESAAHIAACRGRIMHAASHLGRMVQVGVSRDEALALVAPFAGRIELAAENAPRSVVLSGEADAVQEAVARMKEQGLAPRLLPVRYAFHSAVMTRFQPALIRALDGIEPREPSIPIVSTLLGRAPAPGEAFTPAYWARQMREPVEYSKAISVLAREGRTNFVEIGPHPVLATATAESLGDARARACILPTLVRGEPERAGLLAALGALYSRGQSVAWAAVAGKRQWAPLPTYPWQKEKLWIDVAPPALRALAKTAANTPAAHPLLQVTSKLAKPSGACIWEAVLDLEAHPYLRGHRLAGSTVVPASLFVEMAVAASVEQTASCRCVLRDVELLRALILSDEEPARVQLLSTVDDDGATRLEIWSRPDRKPGAAWVLHVTAVLEDGDEHELGAASLPATDGEELSGKDVYAAFHRAGEEYGEAFQGIKRLWRKDSSEIVAELSAPAVIANDVSDYVFHPALLDACMHCMAAARAHDGESGFMPTRFERITVFGRGGPRLWARALVSIPGTPGAEHLAPGTSRASIAIVDERGAPLLDIQGVTLQDLDALGASHRAAPKLDLSACYEVSWRALPPSSKPPAAPGEPRSFVVLGCAGELSAAFCKALEQMGHSVVRAAPSGAALAALLERPDSAYHGVLFLAAPDPAGTADAGIPDRTLCVQVIDVLRTIAHRIPGTEPRLFVVTAGGQVMGREPVTPTQGLLWGLGRSAAAEYPSFWGGIIDAPPGASADETASHVSKLVAQASDETQLLVRGSACHVARLTPLAPHETPAPLVVSRDGAYLVTGGFGALGQTFARFLLGKGAQHVVLLSRSAPSAEHARVMGELSGLGGNVYHAVADVADETQMRGALAALKRDGVPAIRGVLHSAGTVLLKPIAELTDADVDGVFRSKVLGSWVLDRLFADARLDFFVLFSSASAVLQSASLGAYAAANAYQDALAHARRARGEHALTVNWGPWAGDGMAKDTGEGRGPLALRGMGAITAAQGTALLGRFLELDLTQVSVLPIHWATFRAAYPSFDRSPFLSELRTDSTPESKPARLSVLPGGNGKNRRERIEQYLLHRAARALHAEPQSLNAESTLIELGLDSLMLVELRLEIERALGVRLRLMDLLSDPSIRELSTSLEPHVKEVA